MAKQRELYAQVAETLIEKIRSGTAPWQKPWKGVQEAFPINGTTGKRYRGGNMMWLMAQEREDPRWMTYQQAQSVGAQVKKGEKGIPLIYWQFQEEKTVKDEDGQKKKVIVELERPRSFVFTVFNAEQIDGLPAIERPEKRDWDPVQRAEDIIAASGARIEHKAGNRAFYRASEDKIVLPRQEQFQSADGYYSTALHELGHWTGHSSRLDREVGRNPFGSIEYAKEELRAEIASMMLGAEVGLSGREDDSHAAYVGSWCKVLEDDPREIFRAAADAEKIMDYVLELEREKVLGQTARQAAGELLEVDTKTLTQDQREQFIAGWLSAGGSDSDFNTQAPRACPWEHENTVISVAGQTPYDWGKSWLAQNREAVQEEEQQQQQDQTMPAANTQDKEDRTYLAVPFGEKDAARELGAKWDRMERAWYVPSGVDPAPFQHWFPENQAQQPEKPKRPEEQRTYLAVPFGEKAAARELGAKWDTRTKSWYVGPEADISKLEKWLPENQRQPEQTPALDPRQEFAQTLRQMGFVVDGEHPIMDGKSHRAPLEDDRPGQQSGFYVGHLDGRPAGYAKNNRSGEEMRWKSEGKILTPEDKAVFAARSAEKLKARAEELEATHNRTAQRVLHQLGGMTAAEEPTEYMRAKGIGPQTGVYLGKDGVTCLPAQDVDGKVWTMQYIQPDGTKRFAAGGKKEGCFHPVGGSRGVDEVLKAPAIVIAEGYATAASLAKELGFATIAAFDSGNVVHVAEAFREKYPEKAILIAGDDDRHLPTNPGRAKAELAAKKVGGLAVFPIFTPEEKGREFTDFNDLATRSKLGAEAIRRQVQPELNKAIAMRQNWMQQQRMSQNKQQGVTR